MGWARWWYGLCNVVRFLEGYMDYRVNSEESPAGMTTLEIASVGQRVVALVLDMVISLVIPLLAGLVGFAIGLIFIDDPQYDQGAAFGLLFLALGFALFGFLGWSIFVWFLVAKRGQSPGKMVLNIRIANVDGSQFGFRGMLIREIVGKLLVVGVASTILGRIFSQINEEMATLGSLIVCLALVVWILVDDKNQTLHDKIAGTIVVKA